MQWRYPTKRSTLRFRKVTKMGTTRREILASAAAGAAFLGLAAGKAAADEDAPESASAQHKGDKDPRYRPTVTLDGSTLPFRLVDGVKVFHLIVEPVRHEFAPGLVGDCWGLNGEVHGPTIEAVEGDRVRIYVTNRLDAPTSIHWHGLFIPNGMDGVGGLSQRSIDPEETFRYEFTLRQHGTYMYHSHHDEMTQMAMGIMGMFIIHPRESQGAVADHDFVYMLSEWSMDPGMWRPNPNEMADFNILTLNGKAFPGTSPMVVKLGDRVRIRIGNLSAMDHHPIHLHGTSFKVVATDGGQIPEAGQWPETTVLVPTGATRTVEFIADNLGDWAFHCHMTHHVMNQMGHGTPNMIGVDASAFDAALMDHVPEFMEVMDSGAGAGMHDGSADGAAVRERARNGIPMIGGDGPHGYITMGGMFTVLKVREELSAGDASGWFVNPPGTQAGPASPSDLQRDGISPS